MARERNLETFEGKVGEMEKKVANSRTGEVERTGEGKGMGE